MQIVIKIPEEFVKDWEDTRFDDCFKRIRADLNDYRKSNGYGTSGNYEDEIIDMLDNAFCNATPLPKGHGRLGDLDILEQEVVNGIKAGNYEEGYEKYWHINNVDDCVECVKLADTIIEADKEVGE